MVIIGLLLFIKGMQANVELMHDAFQIYHWYSNTKISPEKLEKNNKIKKAENNKMLQIYIDLILNYD